MERKELFAWAKETFGTEPDYPWDDWNCVLRHKHNNKWYALVAEISERKLGISSDRIIDVLNVKCDPLLIGSLRLKPGFYPAYHMNKDKWISISMDGSCRMFSARSTPKTLALRGLSSATTVT